MTKLTPLVTDNDKQIGKAGSKITIVEYGDYQCPYCGMAHPLVQRLLSEKGDDIRFVFRNFPLQSIHDHAMSAALAAEAAHLQNRFWKMHHLLFENQQQFSDDLFIQLAEDLDMNIHQFKRDVSSSETREKIEADFKSGLTSGVNGTPTFFINDQRVRLSELTWEELLYVLENYTRSLNEAVN